jgi:hypothetical protein
MRSCKDKDAAIKHIESGISILSHNSDRLRRITPGNFAHTVNTVISLEDALKDQLEAVLNWLKNESNRCTTKTDGIS